jgi:hypothetical protein
LGCFLSLTLTAASKSLYLPLGEKEDKERGKRGVAICTASSVLRISIGFKTDPDPHLDLYLSSDPDPGSQTNADSYVPDPDSGHTCCHKQLDFDMKNIPVGNM